MENNERQGFQRHLSKMLLDVEGSESEKKIVVVVDRYVVQYGKFGAYFYDVEIEKHLTLLEIAKLLNDYDKMKSVE